MENSAHDSTPGRLGFTLIELSIVLVIIGLLVGGVVVGRDLIKAAELRGFVKQIEQYNTAFITFQIKYNCLPGDCSNETQFFPTLANGVPNVDGDGNGMINTVDVSGYAGLRNHFTESAYAWANLSQAGLIPGSYDPTSQVLGIGWPYVANQTTNGIEIAAYQGKHYYRTGLGFFWGATNAVIAETYTGSNTFTPAEAFSIDTKMDDGTPVGGIIKWVANCAYNCFEVDKPGDVDAGIGWPMIVDGPLGAASLHCYNSTSNQFNSAFTGDPTPGYGSGKICNAAVEAQF